MKSNLQAVRGMQDILPEDIFLWQKLEQAVRNVFASYGYQEIRTPILERQELFERPVGEQSDIVQKELFRLDGDKDKELCMRPEGTIGTLRALAKAGLLRGGSQRVWYMGPMFRRERPQQGRYRQFHQFGGEILGVDSSLADIEMIQLCWRLWQRIEISDKIILEINNLGSDEERNSYKNLLSDYFAKYRDQFSETDQTRIDTNPLRILDSKEEGIEDLLKEAPVLEGSLGKESKESFEQVLKSLEQSKIAYELNPRLVRGLDYYSMTVFEWAQKGVELRQNSIAGGGRYDGLLEKINGDQSPGTGMAAGMERIITLMKASKDRSISDIYLAFADEAFDITELLLLAERFRNEGFLVKTHPTKAKIRTLFKQADASGCSYVAIVGPREQSKNTITIKSLRDDKEQYSLSFAECIKNLQKNK